MVSSGARELVNVAASCQHFATTNQGGGMGKVWLEGLALLVVFLSYNQTAAAAPTDGTPKPHWQIDGTPGVCLLTRTIPGTSPALFAIRTVPGSDRYRFVFAGDQVLETSLASKRRAEVVFGDGQPSINAWSTGIRLSTYPFAIQAELEDGTLIRRLGQAVSVGITVENKTVGLAGLGGAKKAAEALNTCITEQLVQWGADPAQFAPNGMQPVPLRKRDDWLSAEQLAKMDIKHDVRPMHAEYYLAVSVDGKVDGCTRINPDSGKDDADRWICPALVSQRLFEPAHDSAGKAVRGAASFMFDIVTSAQ